MRKLIVIASCLAILTYLPARAQTNTATDVTKPTISGVTVGSVKATTAVVSWTTNEAATSYVDFGLTDVYDKTLGEGSYLTAHSVTLLGMTTNTLYHFRIRSKDAAGNEAVSTDTTLTTTSATVNTNTVSNANTAANTNTVLNTNSTTNKNTNTAKNTNVAVNSNTNKNTNINRNLNANRNTNSNANASANVNSGTDIFNQNVNADSDSVVAMLENTNTDLTNVNTTSITPTSDGRAGIVLIVVGILLLIGIIGFAWWKARRPTNV
jgi:hypothetical protein